MKRAFIKYLNTLEKEDLAKELQKLYGKFPEIKKYYAMELSPNTDKIVAEYKAKIEKEYFKPTKLGRGKSSVSRKVITDFKKIAIHQSDVIELWVYRTEMMAKYTLKRSYIRDSFYNSLVSSYETTCKLITKERLETEFTPRCREIVNTLYEYGWGLPEELKYIYEQYFGESDTFVF